MGSNDLKHPPMRFMLVSVQVIDLGLNLSCWMSSQNMFAWEAKDYPQVYNVQGDTCLWRIRSNIELTNKALAMCVETGDKISSEQIAINNKRKIANL